MKFKCNKYIIIISLIITSLLLLISHTSKSKNLNGEEELGQEIMVSINDSLTNSLSNIPALAPLDAELEKYLEHWGIQGGSLAISRNDSLIYAKSYGWADKEACIKMEPNNLLRIASVSKLITAVGIMSLRDQGMLKLSDPVFGKNGILNDTIYNLRIKDKNYYKITVEHLLRHTAGFSNRAGDPMFSTRDIMNRFDLEQAPKSKELVSLLVGYSLPYIPGTNPAYSNLGYLILSLIIEKISQIPYEDFICENILKPAKIYDMHIGGNTFEEKYPNEVKYYMHEGSELVERYDNTGILVDKCYGGNNITGLQGAGGWIASVAELSRLIASINNYEGISDIISEDGISEMTKFISPEQYGIGWNDITEEGIWTRTGSFSGTTAIIKRYPNGETWIFITNTSTYRGPYFSKYTSSVFSRLRKSYSHLLPKRDLFQKF